MDVFDLFTATNYTFLQLESKTGGNTVVAETLASGVFKQRSGMVQADNMESYGGPGAQEVAATLHVRPTEPFLAAVNAELVGHGVRVEKNGSEPTDYRIIGAVEGYDFDTSQLAFYKVTLKRESIWDESELPLE